MAIRVVIIALQTIHASIPGVVSAPLVYPNAINTNDLPMMLTFPGQGTSSQEAMNSLRRQDRTYLVRGYVDPISQGIRDEKIQQTITLLQLCIEAYINPDNIRLVDQGGLHATIKISAATPVTDTGLAVLPYGPPALQQGYHGF